MLKPESTAHRRAIDRRMFRLNMGWDWLTVNRQDVVKAIEEEAEKEFPFAYPHRKPKPLPPSLQKLK
jgi:hypothetical protein